MYEIEEKYADTIRSLIAHEDEVQNFRFTWFMGAEGFLFAVLGFAWEKGTVLVLLIALSGLLIALSAHVACVLSDKAFIALDNWWKTNLSDYTGPPRKGFELRDIKWKWGGLMPHKFLPFVFGLGWIIVIFHRLYWK